MNFGEPETQLSAVKGCVFDIQRFSVHDGPGIRTVVFLKGCSLHCFWCQNPEGINLKPEIMYFPERCINCGRCVSICPEEAQVMRNGVHTYLRDKCTACGKCTELCYAGSLLLTGKTMSVDEVATEVLKDKKFYEISGGGVTLSGGDVVVQAGFARAILERCKMEGLHSAIETAGNCGWHVLASLMSVTDMIMMDIKLFDSEKHLKATGFSNERILQNARKISGTGKRLIIRTPIIPGVNDNLEDIAAIARFIQSFPNLEYYELLPFHRFGEGKYKNLGSQYAASNLKSPPRELMNRLADEARKYGIRVRVG